MPPTAGIGTKATGYAGPENGPFRCDHCQWYKSDSCGNPAVIADPQMKVKEGRAEVDDGACCNHFRPTAQNHTAALARQLSK